jgi:hypothetical protein
MSTLSDKGLGKLRGSEFVLSFKKLDKSLEGADSLAASQ